jgi:hypothetical protein
METGEMEGIGGGTTREERIRARRKAPVLGTREPAEQGALVVLAPASGLAASGQAGAWVA